jgi:outer membrane protein assembly factor BamB
MRPPKLLDHRAAVALTLAAAASGCGGAGGFTLTSDDNNPERLRAAFALATPAAADAPINERGAPMVYVVAGASKGKAAGLLAYDLAAGKAVWRIDPDVRSRVVTGRAFVAFVDGGGKLAAHRVTDGSAMWSVPIAGELRGVAADAERVFYVAQATVDGTTAWHLVAVDGASGVELWRTRSPGQLGAPAARGGLVFSPFLKQWLVVIDARTGAQLARIRGIDEEISFARADGGAVYFGSKSGVFLLDERAASGRRSQSTYGRAELPDEFVRSSYYWDAFDPVQAGYSAYDRNRLLWRASAQGDELAFAVRRVVVHTYRFLFGFDPTTGDLVWAYNHPRSDVVASEHLGDAIGFVSASGQLGALDPATGGRVYTGAIDVGGPVRGATFDAVGWRPTGEAQPADTERALASIASDRDQRFLDVKLFALTALAARPGGDVAADLLALIRDDTTPAKVRDKAVEVLVARRDVGALPVLVDGLGERYDYIAGAAPASVGVIARAIAAIGDLSGRAEVRPELSAKLIDALVEQLFEPHTPMGVLTEVVNALGAVGLPGALAPLRNFLLTYRADPAFNGEIAAVGATIDALLSRGGVAERELVAFVAADARTQPRVATYAAEALRQADAARAAAGQGRETSAPN